MYCPACKAEYRPGFTRCHDCNVPLVAELAKEDSLEAYVVLWQGEDPALHDTLCEELEKASIEYAETPLEVYLRNSWDPFNLKLGPQLGFVISVAAGSLRTARAILERLLDIEQTDADFTEAKKTPAAGVNDLLPPLHWDPFSATVEIWTGDNLDRLQFLASSLREVGIPSKSLLERQTLRLMARPQDEAQAREIVRQVLEAALPENSVFRSADHNWYDPPVRSYLFAWLPGAIYLGIVVSVNIKTPLGEIFNSSSALDPLFSLVKFVDWIGCLWMLYQAVRYEIRPLRFVLLAPLPFSWIWYYWERFLRRKGRQRLPVAIREGISSRPS